MKKEPKVKTINLRELMEGPPNIEILENEEPVRETAKASQ